MSFGPLAGVRVIDLTRMLSGPYCTMLLADLGADVVKVESLTGDGTRREGPFPDGDSCRYYGGYFQSVNRNKRSLSLDLKRPEGRKVLLRLVDGAQVLVENFRVGVMDRLGLGYEELSRRNPRLVYAAIRGFGDDRTGRSPYAGWPSYDIVAQAMGGLVGITGPDAGHPTKVGPGVGDIFPAALAAVGLLAALHHAEVTGRGQFVDVAMYDAVLALCERIVYLRSYQGTVSGPQGNGHPIFCPFGVFPASDGWVAIAAPDDHFWAVLCQALGCPEASADSRFATNEQRVAHRNEVQEMVCAWTGVRSRQEILAVLGGRVPCGPVNTAEDIIRDPHTAARSMLVDLDHPGAREEVTVVGTPIKMTGTPTLSFRRAPLLGEHSVAVLQDAGFDPDQIAGLMSTGVVSQPESKEVGSA